MEQLDTLHRTESAATCSEFSHGKLLTELNRSSRCHLCCPWCRGVRWTQDKFPPTCRGFAAWLDASFCCDWLDNFEETAYNSVIENRWTASGFRIAGQKGGCLFIVEVQSWKQGKCAFRKFITEDNEWRKRSTTTMEPASRSMRRRPRQRFCSRRYKNSLRARKGRWSSENGRTEEKVTASGEASHQDASLPVVSA